MTLAAAVFLVACTDGASDAGSGGRRKLPRSSAWSLVVLLCVALLVGACSTDEKSTGDGSATITDTSISGGIEDLSWNPTDSRRVGTLSWIGSRWMVSDTADSGILSTVDATADRESWELLALPEGFLPADARGHDASMVSWSTTGPSEIAVSTDAGATWDLLVTDFEALDPAPVEYFNVSHPILGAAVRDDTVIVAVAPSSELDAGAAVEAAGIPQLAGDPPPDDAPFERTTETLWGHDDPADDFVEITDSSFSVFQGVTKKVSFEELGLDRGAHRPRLPMRLLRSVNGGPLQDVTVDLGLVEGSIFIFEEDASRTPGSTLDLGVVDDSFYIVREQQDGATEVLSSPDGLTWQANDFDGSPDTITATDDALFALRGGAVIRSEDVGLTWKVVPTPEGVSQLAAGPSGVLLIQGTTEQSIAWSTNGRDFDWVPLRDRVPFNVDDAVGESMTLTEAVVGDGQILVAIEGVVGPSDYVLEPIDELLGG